MTSCCHCVQAAELAGYKLLLALCDREARPRGRDMFFVDQLVGLKAMDAASGTLLGIVTEVGKRIGPGMMLTVPHLESRLSACRQAFSAIC